MWSIVSKELRELLRLLPVGLVLIGVAVWFSLPQQWLPAPLTGLIPASAALFATLLAAMQGFFDLSDRQRGFLFHRSVSRAGILYGKVLAGLVIYSLAVALPLGCLAIYFAAVGPQSLPVHPLDVLPILATCMAGFVLHPATLLAIDRQASWFGTKLLPLPLAIVGVFGIAIIVDTVPVTVIAVVLLLFAFIVAALFAALQSENLARRLVLASSALVVVVTTIIYGATTLESLFRQPTRYSVAYGFDASGDLWMYQQQWDHYSGNGYQQTAVPISGDRFRPDQPLNLEAPLPDDFKPRALSTLITLERRNTMHTYQYAGQIERKWLFDSTRGNVLVYDMNAQPPLHGSVSRSGFHPTAKLMGEPFAGPVVHYGMAVSSPLLGAGYEALWVDQAGVYQFDRETGSINRLIDLPIESATILLVEPETSADADTITDGDEQASNRVYLYLESDTRAHLFALGTTTGDFDWLGPNQENRYQRLPPLQAVEERSMPRLPPALRGSYPMLGLTSDGVLHAFSLFRTYGRAVLPTTPNAHWQHQQLAPPQLTGAAGTIASVWIGSLTPPALIIVGTVGMWIESAIRGLPTPTSGLPEGYEAGMIGLGLATMIISLALVWWLTGRRGMGLSARLAWIVATLFFGLATPLMVIALYRRVHREPCPRCEHLRRIDRQTCSHCGSAWEANPSEGIELLDRGVELGWREQPSVVN